jgi:hypothetical protein
MTQVPPNIQNQLGEAVSVIADSDFWERWDTLVDVRVSRRSSPANSSRISSAASPQTTPKSTTACSRSPTPYSRDGAP